MKKSFWKDGLSIKETKFSIIGFMLILVFIFALVYLAIHRQLDDELIEMFNSLLLAFVGINAVDRVSTALQQEGGGNDNGI
ncbi:hypothetical protein [Peribacillus frigoritolerans]|uniref:Uncharacterized protein n=1 Tax=Peribacillus castrilensis TaxID=2897690 RepID=A0AAW9NP54_9BACI|nr:hypothetical protein [Peribacillus castrilensis]